MLDKTMQERSDLDCLGIIMTSKKIATKKNNINKKTKIREYEISWHNPIVADSITEAYEFVKSILADLEKLAQWEKEGKTW